MRRRVPPKTAPEPARPLTYRLDELSVDGGLVHWLDERGTRPIELELRDLHSRSRNVSSAPGSRLTFEVTGLTDLKETIALDGEAALQPIEVSGKLRIEQLSLPRLWPLVEPFLAAELTSGRLDAGTRFSYQARTLRRSWCSTASRRRWRTSRCGSRARSGVPAAGELRTCATVRSTSWRVASSLGEIRSRRACGWTRSANATAASTWQGSLPPATSPTGRRAARAHRRTSRS